MVSKNYALGQLVIKYTKSLRILVYTESRKSNSLFICWKQLTQYEKETFKWNCISLNADAVILIDHYLVSNLHTTSYSSSHW